MPKDVNNNLLDSILRHQHFVRSYENKVLKSDILPLLLKAKGEMENKLKNFGKNVGVQNLSQLTKMEMKQLDQQIKELGLIIKQANQKIAGTMSANLSQFSKAEEKIMRSILGNALPIKIGLNRVPLEQIKKIVDTPLGGIKFGARLQKNYGDAVNVMKREIASGIIKGESIDQVTRRLIGTGKNIGGMVGDVVTKRSEMIARSEIMRVSNSVSDEVFSRNQDVIKGVEWVSTLDPATCIECAELDGAYYDYDKGEDAPWRPIHPNCRCVVVPVTRSWEELGDNSNMAKKLDDLDPGARASMTGYLPANVPYPTWFDAQPDDFKIDVLGKNRFQVYKTKGLQFNQMVKTGRWVSLKNLSALSTGEIPKAEVQFPLAARAGVKSKKYAEVYERAYVDQMNKMTPFIKMDKIKYEMDYMYSKMSLQRLFHQWADDSKSEGGSIFKILSNIIFGEKGRVSTGTLSKSEFVKTLRSYIKNRSLKFSSIKNEFVDSMARVHAILKHEKGDFVIVYRGIDGRTGEELARRIINKQVGEFVGISEDALVSTSSRISVAKEFAVGGGNEMGVVIKYRIPVTDFVYSDLCVSTQLSAFSESEYILKGRFRKVNLKDIKIIRRGPYG